MLHQMLANIFWLQPDLKFFKNEMLMCQGRFQQFELFHHFKQFVTYIYVVISSCPVVTHFNLIVSEDRSSRSENFQP